MHILFYTHYFPPEVNAPASRTYEHAKYWVKAGHDVTVITNHPNHPHGELFEGYENKLFSREIIDGIQVVRLWTFLVPNSGFLRRSLNYVVYALLAFLAGLRIHHVDIVIGTTPQFFCGISGLMAARVKKTPFIGEVRDLWPDSIAAVEACKSNLIIKILYKMEQIFYLHSDHLVVLTQSFAKHIAALSNTPCTFIPNGVDWYDWQPMFFQQNGNGHLPLGNGSFKVGYIGTIGMAHGLDVVLDVAKSTEGQADIQYYIIGDGAERVKLQERLEDEAIQNLHMYGLQTKKLIPGILDQLDVMLVLLRRDDLFKTVIPSKIFEGMVMGKPLIVGVEGETKQIMNDAEAGITITPKSREELKSAIMDLYKDPDMREQLGQNGRAYIKRYFLRDQLAHRFLPIFAELHQNSNGSEAVMVVAE